MGQPMFFVNVSDILVYECVLLAGISQYEVVEKIHFFCNFFSGGNMTFFVRYCTSVSDASGAENCTDDRTQIKKFIYENFNEKPQSLANIHGRLCYTTKCNTVMLKKIKNKENNTSTTQVEEIKNTPTATTEWQTSHYIANSAMNITSRRKSTTLHLELSDVTIVDNLSTPSLAAGQVKSNQILMSLLYVLCIALLLI